MDRVLNILINQWEYDISVMSESWMYYWVLPAIGYTIFFFLKWSFLTLPFWLPLNYVVSSFKPSKK